MGGARLSQITHTRLICFLLCAGGAVIPERDNPAAAAAAAAASAAAVAAGLTLAPPAAPSTPPSGSSAAASAASAASAVPAPPIIPCLSASALDPKLYPTSYVTQTFFLSRSTDSKLEKDRWVGSPNMLLRSEIYYPNQYRAQDASKMRSFDEDQRNPCLVIKKKIVHPGEINRIKVCPLYPDLIATHTDSPLVYVWNTNSQPNRRSALNQDPSTPDLTLQGHEDCDGSPLYYALDCSKLVPHVISGGSDHKICLWSIEDYCSTLLTTAYVEQKAAQLAAPHSNSATIGKPLLPPPSKKHIQRLLSPRLIFSGHTAQVEEVSFHPSHPDLLCSVGDDQLLMIWDQRLGGNRAALAVQTGHTDDVNAVAWNTVNENLLITGSSDTTVKLLDMRRFTAGGHFTERYSSSSAVERAQWSHLASAGQGVVHTFNGHSRNVTNVGWHMNGEYFASGSDDGDLCVWSIRAIDGLLPLAPTQPAAEASSMQLDNHGAAAATAAPASGVAAAAPSSTTAPTLPPASLRDGSDGRPAHLVFRHAGHRTAVVNFAWNHFVKDGQRFRGTPFREREDPPATRPCMPVSLLLLVSVLLCVGWTMASLSDDSADETLVGGGRLHVWRITDLLHKDYTQTAAEFAARNTQAQQQQQQTDAAAANAAAASSSTPPGSAAAVAPEDQPQHAPMATETPSAQQAMPLDMPTEMTDAVATPMVLDE